MMIFGIKKNQTMIKEASKLLIKKMLYLLNYSEKTIKLVRMEQRHFLPNLILNINWLILGKKSNKLGTEALNYNKTPSACSPP